MATDALHLSFLLQPPLPHLPNARQGALDRPAQPGIVARTVFPFGVYATARLEWLGWLTLAKAPLGGPAQVLASLAKSLARYTHRIAISNGRLTSLHDGTVTFAVRNNEPGGPRKRQERLPANIFIHRFMQHVPPSGLKRFRHYGVLACAIKRQNWPYAARP